MKNAIRLVHLWSSLVFGTVLVVLGLTGTALAWMHEFDAWLNPELLQAAPPAGMAEGARFRVSPATTQAVVERLAADTQYGRPGGLMLPESAGDVFVATYRPEKKNESMWKNDLTRHVMVDPSTLAVLGERKWGENGFSRRQLMPTLFHIHRYLVAGEVGKVVIAMTGVFALVAALTGLVLWWPRMSRSALWQALTVRHGGNWPRFNFQLHRAAGFFAAPVFLMMGVSGVSFNMPQWVTPVVGSVATITPPGRPSNQHAKDAAGVNVADALAAAQRVFPEAQLSRISLPAKPNQPYEVRVLQAGELRESTGSTRISIDSGDGAVLRVIDPLRAPGGDRFMMWMFPLHTGEALGTAGRAFISLFGLMPLMFFVTGLVVWIKLRRKKRARAPLRAGMMAQV